MKCGLKKDVLEKINEIFEKYDKIQEVILYGSRAKGSFKPGSDIDLTLKGKDINLKLVNKISLELDDLLLPYTFDLSIYNSIDEPALIEHIQRVGEIFYRRKQGNSQHPDKSESLDNVHTGYDKTS